MFENMLQMWHVEQHLVPRKVCQKDQHDEEAAVTCCCAQPQRMATRAGPGVRETQHPTQPPSSLRHATPSGELSLPLPSHQRPTPQAFALVCPVPSPHAPCSWLALALLLPTAGTVTHRTARVTRLLSTRACGACACSHPCSCAATGLVPGRSACGRGGVDDDSCPSSI